MSNAIVSMAENCGRLNSHLVEEALSSFQSDLSDLVEKSPSILSASVSLGSLVKLTLMEKDGDEIGLAGTLSAGIDSVYIDAPCCNQEGGCSVENHRFPLRNRFRYKGETQHAFLDRFPSILDSLDHVGLAEEIHPFAVRLENFLLEMNPSK